MNIEMVMGWIDMDAVTILKILDFIPYNSPDEFAISETGINHIKDKINDFELKYHIVMDWKIIENKLSDNTYILVWDNIFNNTFGDPEDTKIDIWQIKYDIMSELYDKFKFIITSNPLYMNNYTYYNDTRDDDTYDDYTCDDDTCDLYDIKKIMPNMYIISDSRSFYKNYLNLSSDDYESE